MKKRTKKIYGLGSPSIEDIDTRFKDKSEERGLVVTPLISKKQIKGNTIDIRLGNEFIITKKTRFDMLDPSIGKEKAEVLIKQYQEKVYVDLGDKLILHPNQFVLGSTLEHVRLPWDLLAYVVGRSSWGRLGLIIATATVVHPGYSGTITLELTNLGDAPITLYPGSRIAQLIFHTVNPSKIPPTKSKYDISTGPVFSKIYEDYEWPAYEYLKGENDALTEIIKSNYINKQITREQYEKMMKVLGSNKNQTISNKS